jgi:S1-C subfamily serine protease
MVERLFRLPLLVILIVWSGAFSGPASADLVHAIERVKPSIVMVGVYKKTGSPKFTLRGTGFVVGDGLTVATNAHVLADLVVDGDASLVVLAGSASPGTRDRPARSWIVDREHDLALLKVDGPAMPTLSLRDSSSVKEGQMVAFTGFPIGEVLGFTPVTHRGTISAVTPIALPSPNARDLRESVIRRLKGGSFDIFQLDATAYPGNSGGPLFDAETGEVLGIINMVLVKATKEAALTHPSGISYAIPANYLRDLLSARE